VTRNPAHVNLVKKLITCEFLYCKYVIHQCRVQQIKPECLPSYMTDMQQSQFTQLVLKFNKYCIEESYLTCFNLPTWKNPASTSMSMFCPRGIVTPSTRNV